MPGAHAGKGANRRGRLFGTDGERALDLLKTWEEADNGLVRTLALVGSQTAINDQCRELLQA